MNQKEKSGIKKAVLALLVALVAAMLLLYFVFAFYYRTHFFPKTTINGIPVGGQTISIVEDEIAEQIKSYELTLVESDGTTETIRGDEIGVKPSFHGELQALMKEQGQFLWFLGLIRGSSSTVRTIVSCDEVALRLKLESLSCMNPEYRIAPSDAHLSDYTADGFTVIPEKAGNIVSELALHHAAREAVETLRPTLDLVKADCYENPAVTSEDPELLALAEKLNALTTQTITYEMDEETRTIPGETLASWLIVDEKNRVSFDENAVASFVDTLAEETDTYGEPRDFKTSTGETVTFQSVYYGWKIDREAETAQLLADLIAGADVDREPIYTYRGASRGDHDYGDTYVEVNLSNQHLWCYKDGELALDANVVTGNVGKGTITHVGLYSIYSKETDRYLVGENYRSYVNYWMPFNGGEGLHDATWRSAFGGTTYLTNGSHGCVNLSKSVAGEIYELVDVGTPVFIYRLDSTVVASESEIASMAVSAINSVGGAVTLGSETALTRARNFYNYLSSENKGLVTNYELLPVYEAQLATLKSQTAAASAAASAAAAAQTAAQNALLTAQVGGVE